MIGFVGVSFKCYLACLLTNGLKTYLSQEMRIHVSGHVVTRNPVVYTVDMDTVNRYNNARKQVFFLLIMAGIIYFANGV